MLKEMFVKYIKDIQSIREKQMDSNNIDFHQKNELHIKAPPEWNLREELVETLKNTKSSLWLVFYADTPSYHSIYDLMEKDDDLIEFCSFFELHSAIINSSQDIRHQQRIQNSCSSAAIVVVLDASRCPYNVLSAIRQFTTGALILLD